MHVFHVSPSGDDQSSGSETRPFATLDRAREAVRSIKKEKAPAQTTFEIRIHPGIYRLNRPIRFTPEDSGTQASPIVYRATGSEAPTFSGGKQLRNFRRTTDPDVLDRLVESARSLVWETDPAEAGVTTWVPFEPGGFSSGRGFRTHPAMELFVNGQPMTWARWPNEGFVKTGETPGPLTLSAWDRKPGSPEGRFRFSGDRPARWIGESDAWLYGYWFWDWADSYEKIEQIDLANREIRLAKPWHQYGFRKDQRYYAVNLLSELDVPGEWYLDRVRRRLFVIPRENLHTAQIEISELAAPLLELDQVSHLRFEGLVLECGASDGVLVRGGENCAFRGCTVRKSAGNGFDIRGGKEHVIQSCDLHTLGRGGIALAGGDRRTLAPSGHRVENCHIHHLSRIDHTYTPGIWMDGVGHQIRHNQIHHVASSALRVEGNEHLIEFNEVFQVVLESDDQGAVDMFGNPTYRGVIYRYNYWHHLGTWDGTGDTSHTQRAGIRLDDAICGVWIYGNIFQRCSTGKTHFGGVQIHGGKENVVERNLFIDTAAAVSFTPWGDTRWRGFVEKALDAPNIDRNLYLARYPSLASLAEGHDLNRVRSNVTLRCPTLSLRAPPGTAWIDNRELGAQSDLPEGPDGRIQWNEESAARLNLAHIPFAKMGLYEDAWRRRSGEIWIVAPER